MINDYEATKPMTSDAEPIGDRTMSNDDIVSTLNSLIETCKDGQEGFKHAAEGVEQRHHISDQLIEGVSPLRRVGPAMAAVVVEDHAHRRVVDVGQPEALVVPGAEAVGVPVQEQHGQRGIRWADLLHVQRRIVAGLTAGAVKG